MTFKGVMLSWGVPAMEALVRGFVPLRTSPLFQAAFVKRERMVGPWLHEPWMSASKPWIRTSAKLMAWEIELLAVKK